MRREHVVTKSSLLSVMYFQPFLLQIRSYLLPSALTYQGSIHREFPLHSPTVLYQGCKCESEESVPILVVSRLVVQLNEPHQMLSISSDIH